MNSSLFVGRRNPFQRKESIMTKSSSETKTVVLVHGGFVDGSGWEGVYNILRKDGYTVAIVQNPTISLADDVAVTKRVIDPMNNELSAGTAISHYRIVSKIGAGGMGEVYRARDTRLDREVAIKLLPAEVSTEADRLQRFEQEARATSALNHPSILTVYDIGTHDGSPYILAEL